MKGETEYPERAAQASAVSPALLHAKAGACDRFLQEMARFPFERCAIEDLIDRKRRYHLPFDPLFPFSIRLFSYEVAAPFPRIWHEHLEIFIPCAGEGIFTMGTRNLSFTAGDVLVVDNLQPHGILQVPGGYSRAMVIGFSPEFVCAPGALPCDRELLEPFYQRTPENRPVFPAGSPQTAKLHDALLRLADCYFEPAGNPRLQAGCKAYLLEILYLLATRSTLPARAQQRYVQKPEEPGRLDRLNRYLSVNLSERITVASAASIVNMSESAFMKSFKRTTGETFVSHLTRLRMDRAADFLRRTNRSIAEISFSVGYADQSYFDRVFRKHFSRTPREVRRDRQK